jgi:hypothetical protein
MMGGPAAWAEPRKIGKPLRVNDWSAHELEAAS